jgi:peptide/nickel transport system ATP-binding protein
MYAGRIVEIGPVRRVIRQPLHPYTRGLMAAIPHVGGEVSALAQIEGSMPRLDAIPPGCAFNPRCPQRFAPCTGAVPELLQAEPGHSAACFLYGEPQRGGRP